MYSYVFIHEILSQAKITRDVLIHRLLHEQVISLVVKRNHWLILASEITRFGQ